VALAVDTSVLVSYFNKDDSELYTKASSLLKAAKSNSVVLDRVLVAELGYVLKSVYGLDKDQVVAVYKALLANNIFSVPDRELLELTIDLFDIEKPLSFEDCWMLSLKHYGKVTEVLTFDTGLIKRVGL
jgi:predicted nucleic-acid-binding protein